MHFKSELIEYPTAAAAEGTTKIGTFDFIAFHSMQFTLITFC